MTCRHSAGDPNCSSNRNRFETSSYVAPATPDKENYSIEEVERVGAHLVMKVKYPNCRNCAYEGVKTMVFLNVSEAQALRWRMIDPHFRAPKVAVANSKEAPSPAARFPGSVDGWEDALAYAKTKNNPKV